MIAHTLNHKEFINHYRTLYPLYEEFVEEMVSLIKKSANDQGLGYKVIEGRAKKPESVADKIECHNILNPLTDIYDLAGARIVCHFEDEKEAFRLLIKSLFEITWYEDKLKKLGTDRMGYVAEHFVVRLSKGYLNEKFNVLIEPICEIQLKSTLHSALDEITHMLTYKKEDQFDPKTLRKINTLRVNTEWMQEELDELYVRELTDIKVKKMKTVSTDANKLV